jgi:hypothetical protein
VEKEAYGVTTWKEQWLMDEHLKAFEQFQTTAIDLAVNFGPKLLAAMLILTAGVVASRWVLQVIGPAQQVRARATRAICWRGSRACS